MLMFMWFSVVNCEVCDCDESLYFHIEFHAIDKVLIRANCSSERSVFAISVIFSAIYSCHRREPPAIRVRNSWRVQRQFMGKHSWVNKQIHRPYRVASLELLQITTTTTNKHTHLQTERSYTQNVGQIDERRINKDAPKTWSKLISCSKYVNT